VAVRFPGAVGAGAAPAALNATTCKIHPPAFDNVAVAWYEPTAVTTLSSTRSPSGSVISRLLYPLPAADVLVSTVFAPTSRSFALLVTAAPLSIAVAVPVPTENASSGLFTSNPLYSRIRMSG
jgi:hypothetical protein